MKISTLREQNGKNGRTTADVRVECRKRFVGHVISPITNAPSRASVFFFRNYPLNVRVLISFQRYNFVDEITIIHEITVIKIFLI